MIRQWAVLASAVVAATLAAGAVATTGGAAPSTSELRHAERRLDSMCAISATSIVLDTDANNELDDQHAIAYAVLHPALHVELLTINATRFGGGVDEHAAEAERVLRLLRAEGRTPIVTGAEDDYQDLDPVADAPQFEAAWAIVDAVTDPPCGSSTTVVAIGKLTNVALALDLDPGLDRRLDLVWLGSNFPWPGEYNLDDDVAAVNRVLRSETDLRIAVVRPGTGTGTAAVRMSLDEVRAVMPGLGPRRSPAVTGRDGGTHATFGDYSVALFEAAEMHGDPPGRSLYDLAAVAAVADPTLVTESTVRIGRYTGDTWTTAGVDPRPVGLLTEFDADRIIASFVELLRARTGP